MPGRTGKVTAKPPATRQFSPEIPTPVKATESTTSMDDEEMSHQPSVTLDKEQAMAELNPMSLLLANGQPLLTNFEEKYLIDLLLKGSNQDMDTVLEEKLSFILQMNYGSLSSLFRLNSVWIYDFCLKHFQALIDHGNASMMFERILKKTFDRNDSTVAFKHWQLQTLVNEHLKKQPHSASQKRRMTVRRLDFPL